MCGICGYAGFESDAHLLHQMTDSIIHRGPDEDGFFEQGTVGLGMRRLAIIDVASGQQPITNEDSSLVIVFNGEIYNYRDLMLDLQQRGHHFKTRCDTETILHLYEEYGTDCVSHLRGMFTFAIYDLRRERLFIARDRLGVKPLYYWSQDGKILFGSEIKALLEYDGLAREPNLALFDAYLSLRYVPGPETLFQGVYKLSAAHWLLWERGQIQIERYWTLPDAPAHYQSDEYYQERFNELFAEAVRIRMMSEVPLGAFLSGGIDSTAIVSTMSDAVENAVQTFSVGFDWKGDELSLVREVAPRLHIDSHEIICKPEHINLLPKIVWHLDEPVGDAIVLPMYLLSRLARQHVTVVLSGEGADETLAGYFPHRVMMWSHYYANYMPGLLQRHLVAPLVRYAPVKALNLAFDYPEGLGQRGKQKLIDYLELIRQGTSRSQYHFLLSLFDARDKKHLYTDVMQQVKGTWEQNGGTNGHRMPQLEKILRLQYQHWLQDDILTKQDKMSMANSIEARVPYLDHKLVEFLAQTPPHLKLNLRENKRLLRRYLQRQLPESVARRPKKAFYFPLSQYLNTPFMRDLINMTFAKETVLKRGYFHWETMQQLLNSMNGGDFLYGKQILAIIMLELWQRIFIDREKGWV